MSNNESKERVTEDKPQLATAQMQLPVGYPIINTKEERFNSLICSQIPDLLPFDKTYQPSCNPGKFSNIYPMIEYRLHNHLEVWWFNKTNSQASKKGPLTKKFDTHQNLYDEKKSFRKKNKDD